MIRLMRRRPVVRLVALAAVLGVVSTGIPSLHEAALEASDGKKPATAWFLQALNDQGGVVDFERTILTAKSQKAPVSPQLPGDISQLRQELQARKMSANPKTAERATRLLRWLDIAGANTAAERHEKIRNLPVTITTSPATDGRNGVVRNYIAGGKIRMRRFIPSLEQLGSEERNEPEQPSGPAAREECYDNEPEPCATQQEMEDYDIVLAETQYELEWYESENNAAYEEYSNFCSSHPEYEGCQDPNADQIISGPSARAFAGCWTQAGYATQWVGVGLVNLGFRYAARAGAAAMGTTLSAATVAASTAALVGSAFMAGYYVGSFIDCKVQQMYEPTFNSNHFYSYEPVYP